MNLLCAECRICVERVASTCSYVHPLVLRMVNIRRITISPPLMNSSSAWASGQEQLQSLYNCQYTGAVTTRTATLQGFQEDLSIHTVSVRSRTAHIPSKTNKRFTFQVAFTSPTISSVNSYGYSPHPLSQYLTWVEAFLVAGKSKPFILSITSSVPEELNTMIDSIQQLRRKLGDDQDSSSRIAIEINTSCPNIAYAPPPSYDIPETQTSSECTGLAVLQRPNTGDWPQTSSLRRRHSDVGIGGRYRGASPQTGRISHRILNVHQHTRHESPLCRTGGKERSFEADLTIRPAFSPRRARRRFAPRARPRKCLHIFEASLSLRERVRAKHFHRWRRGRDESCGCQADALCWSESRSVRDHLWETGDRRIRDVVEIEILAGWAMLRWDIFIQEIVFN